VIIGEPSGASMEAIVAVYPGTRLSLPSSKPEAK